MISLEVVAQAFNPSVWETEAGGFLWLWGQPDLQSQFLDRQEHTEKPCLERQINK